MTVSGIKVGSVSSIKLDNGDALVGFTINGKYALGNDTTAHIRTGTLLGERVLALESAGSGTLSPNSVIPISRTSSPYSLTDAVNELTSNTAGTNTESLNQSLDTLSQTLDQIAPQLGPTFDGVSRLSQVAEQPQREPGGAAEDRGRRHRDPVRAQREGQRADPQLATICSACSTSAGTRSPACLLPRQRCPRSSARLVANNEKELAPTLEKLNDVTAMLEKNKDNLAKMLPGAAKYYLTQGEIVANGAYYNALVPNLVFGQLLQPFLDYAFGFRRGVNAGQPPDNAGPRAELPFPVNSIPQPGDLPNDGDPGEPQP